MEGLHEAFLPRFAETFAEIADESGQQLAATVAANDINTLQRECEVLEEYADRVLAHIDKRQPKVWPMYEHFDRALEAWSAPIQVHICRETVARRVLDRRLR